MYIVRGRFRINQMKLPHFYMYLQYILETQDKQGAYNKK